MPDDHDFLTCIRECEADLDSSDPAATKRLMRKIGLHLIRVHTESADIKRSVNLLVDRLRWTVVVLSAIAATCTFVLMVFTALSRFWK